VKEEKSCQITEKGEKFNDSHFHSPLVAVGVG